MFEDEREFPRAYTVPGIPHKTASAIGVHWALGQATQLASGSSDRTVKLWDTSNGAKRLTLSDSTAERTAQALGSSAGSGGEIASSSSRNRARSGLGIACHSALRDFARFARMAGSWTRFAISSATA